MRDLPTAAAAAAAAAAARRRVRVRACVVCGVGGGGGGGGRTAEDLVPSLVDAAGVRRHEVVAPAELARRRPVGARPGPCHT